MRSLKTEDRIPLERILRETGVFTPEEIDCSLELLDTVLNDPHQQDYRVTVAEKDDEVAGYILFGPVPLAEGTFDIYWIATDPRLHGSGYGRLLLEHTEKALETEGARMICLETSSQDSYVRTRRFYLKAGYLEESRIGDFYRPGDDRITYVKRFPKE